MKLKDLSLRTYTILLTVLLTVIAFLFDIIMLYNNFQEEFERSTQEKLFTAAVMAREITGQDYHDNLYNATSLPLEQYKMITDKFGDICTELKIDGLWSVMLIENRVVFTSSSNIRYKDNAFTVKEFFDIHNNQKRFKEIFHGGKITNEIQEINGDIFYNTIIPYTDMHGRQYAFGATLNTHNYYSKIIVLMRRKILSDLLLFVPLILVFYLILRNLTRPFNIISDHISNITFNNYHKDKFLNIYGTKEVATLTKSISMMIDTILDSFNTIQSQEKDIRTTLLSIGDGVIVTNNSGIVTRINKEAERLTGWSAKEATGQPVNSIFNIVDITDTEQPLSPFETVISTGKNYYLERNIQLISKDNKRYYISDSAAPVYNDENILSSVVICFKDITKEFEQEENLKLTYARLLEIQSYAHMGYWEFSFSENKGWFSEEFCKIYGLDLFTNIDSSFIQQLSNATLNFNEETFRKNLLSGKDFKQIHEILNQKTKEKKFVELYLKPVVNSKGELQKIFGMTKDITEQQSLIAQLQHSQRLDAIGQLAGGIAHDFNNMLGGILGFTELINHEITGNLRLEEYCRQIIKTSENAANLTQQLLSFARKGKIVSSPINIHDVIKSAIKLLNRSIDKKIKIDLELNAEQFSVIGDPSQLQSAILNLGINARDAMPNGGTMTISTENVNLNQVFCNNSSFDIEPGNYILIKTIDTGTGIKKELLNRIFEPFFTTKGVGKGTGLGLSAIFGTIITHHGAITVYSEISRGTEFHIYLPLQEEDNESTLATAEDSIQNLSGNETILIADDEEVIRIMAQALLKELGYTTILAENGADAIIKYKKFQKKIDLVILDVMMPIMDGMDCMHELKKINPEVKIIIASGFSKSDNTNDFLANGAADFINKPYRQKELAMSIKNILKQ